MREQRTIGTLDALTGQVNYPQGPGHTGHRNQYLVIAGLPHVLATIQQGLCANTYPYSFTHVTVSECSSQNTRYPKGVATIRGYDTALARNL
jgi:hypothetical protein